MMKIHRFLKIILELLSVDPYNMIIKSQISIKIYLNRRIELILKFEFSDSYFLLDFDNDYRTAIPPLVKYQKEKKFEFSFSKY